VSPVAGPAPPGRPAGVASPGPTPAPRLPGVAACLAAIRRPELYRNFAIHLFVMAPAVVLMCLFARWVDRALGLERLVGWPLAGWLGAAMIGVGGLSVWYVYGYLYLVGGGSPGTHVDGGPTALVDTGPYTLLRHPSVPGKFLAAGGVGVLFGSPAFLLGFLPTLLLYSFLTNRYLQEPTCDQRFGALYERYRRTVPMFLPRPSGVRRLLRGEAAVGAEPGAAPAAHPAAVRFELLWYLVGLLGMILLFAGVALALRGLAR
jgi:protein-S-isoprenylcysteine O-methyltransferase Ste14